jgi:hypothetical protein
MAVSYLTINPWLALLAKVTGSPDQPDHRLWPGRFFFVNFIRHVEDSPSQSSRCSEIEHRLELRSTSKAKFRNWNARRVDTHTHTHTHTTLVCRHAHWPPAMRGMRTNPAMHANPTNPAMRGLPANVVLCTLSLSGKKLPSPVFRLWTPVCRLPLPYPHDRSLVWEPGRTTLSSLQCL